MKNLLAALLVALACIGVAQAGPAATAPHGYVGAGAAATGSHHGSGKVNPKVFGGYALSDSLAFEGGYIDLRKAAAAPQARTIDLGGFGMYVAAKITRPLMDTLSAYGMLGVAQSQRKSSTLGVLRKETDTGAYAGFGLQYSVTKNVKATAGYERYGKDKKTGAKADAWTVGVEVAF
jgi:opacity protein-like surface antigen